MTLASWCFQAIAEAGQPRGSFWHFDLLDRSVAPMTDMPIELHVTAITADDYVDAFAARDRVARTARYASRPVLVGVGLVGLLTALLGRIWWVAVVMGMFTVLVGFPTLLYRRISRRLVRDNPGLHGPATLTVTEDGLRTRTAATEAWVGWSRYQRYVETTES